MMTIEQAIEHAEQVEVNNCSAQCREDHRQLALWLRELKQLRAENARLKAELANANASALYWQNEKELVALRSQQAPQPSEDARDAALKLARNALVQWHVPENRYAAIEAIDAAIATIQKVVRK